MRNAAILISFPVKLRAFAERTLGTAAKAKSVIHNLDLALNPRTGAVQASLRT